MGYTIIDLTMNRIVSIIVAQLSGGDQSSKARYGDIEANSERSLAAKLVELGYSPDTLIEFYRGTTSCWQPATLEVWAAKHRVYDD